MSATSCFIVSMQVSYTQLHPPLQVNSQPVWVNFEHTDKKNGSQFGSFGNVTTEWYMPDILLNPRDLWWCGESWEVAYVHVTRRSQIETLVVLCINSKCIISSPNCPKGLDCKTVRSLFCSAVPMNSALVNLKKFFSFYRVSLEWPSSYREEQQLLSPATIQGSELRGLSTSYSNHGKWDSGFQVDEKIKWVSRWLWQTVIYACI